MCGGGRINELPGFVSGTKYRFFNRTIRLYIDIIQALNVTTVSVGKQHLRGHVVAVVRTTGLVDVAFPFRPVVKRGRSSPPETFESLAADMYVRPPLPSYVYIIATAVDVSATIFTTGRAHASARNYHNNNRNVVVVVIIMNSRARDWTAGNGANVINNRLIASGDGWRWDGVLGEVVQRTSAIGTEHGGRGGHDSILLYDPCGLTICQNLY